MSAAKSPMPPADAHDNCLKYSGDLVGSANLRDPGGSISSGPHDPVCVELLLNENDGHGVVDIAG